MAICPPEATVRPRRRFCAAWVVQTVLYRRAAERLRLWGWGEEGARAEGLSAWLC